MTALYILLAFVLGCLTATFIAKRIIINGIMKADICEDDRRMIRDVLGIPNKKGLR